MDLILFTRFLQLFGWLPLPLQAVAGAVLAIAMIWAVCRIIGIIMDIIPLL